MKKITFRIVKKLCFLITILNTSIYLNAQCNPTGNTNWDSFGITNVTVNGDAGSSINNTSGIQQSYVDNTSVAANVTAGNTYNFSVENQKETWGNLKMRFWIDYDGTGNYTQVYDSGGYINNNNGTQTFTGSFTISPTASMGNVVLRIAASYCSNCGGGATMATDGCSFQGRAEIEDYTLTIGGSGGSTSYCNPTSIGNYNTLYVSNFNLGTINNTTTGNTGGYNNYSSITPTEINPGQTFNGNIEVAINTWNTSTNTVIVWIDFNSNGSFEDSGERFLYNFQNSSNSSTVNVPINFLVPTNAQLGTTRIRIGVRGGNSTAFTSCDYNSSHGEIEDYSIDINSLVPTQDISLLGNTQDIFNGSTTTSTDNSTDFGLRDINSGGFQEIFEIVNDGTLALVLTSPYVSLSGSADFTIISQPADINLSPGESTTFIIEYDPSTDGSSSTTVSVFSDDPDENPFTFLIEGEGGAIYKDTDGDGVSDIIDIDDDNDGLEDGYETNLCTASPAATTTDLIFLNETFGSGLNRVPINGTYAGVTTTYCYENGTGSCNGSINVVDGNYTVHHTITNNNNIQEDINTDIAIWAEDFWYEGEDHTPGDTNGRMAIFNATADPGVFYSQSIIGATPNVPVQFGFYAINIDRDDAPNVASRIRPEVVITIYDPNGNVISSETSGLIEPTSPAGDWVEVSASFTSSFSEFTVELSNANLGGIGNDLAIDDVFVKQTLCDLDGDGVADLLDLDNDNDGIPNVVELGLIDDNNDATVFGDSTNTWVDVNFNGMHDAYENLTPLDTDGDGTPDFLDLDSDNDGIFDNVEYDGLGDVDVSGDGVGDGSDFQDLFANNLNDDPDGDGILAIIDDNDDDNGSSSDHGTFSYAIPLDSDNDGTPDYLDIDSNDASNNPADGSDIDETLYASLDADNDGDIDGSTDSDNDGILDNFDTDNTIFGSPRDLDRKLTLYFDGRNDYVEDEQIISGWSEITLMGWINYDSAGAGRFRILFGQNNFSLRLLPDNKLQVIANGTSITYSSAIQASQWIHVAASYSSSSNELKLYINGEEVNVKSINGSLAMNTKNFTIGKFANSNNQFYNGYMDEVRLFDKALSNNEIQKIVYQEIEQNGANIRGSEIPKDVTDFVDANTITPLPWSNLVRYYRFDNFKDDITDNLTTPTIDTGTGAKLYNIKQIEYQSAPMPFVTQNSGSLENAVSIPSAGVDGNDAIDYDWSIVRVEHDDVTFNNSQKHLGLFINEEDTNSNPIEFHVTDDSELNVSWYLKLDGFIDLEGESQLIQGEESTLDPISKGKIERDQQGTADTYTYNYWSSPVTLQNSTSNNFAISDVIRDGTDPNNPVAINFISSGHDGSPTNPIGIADHWIWKYANLISDDYSSWQHVRQTSTLNAGEGFTMKGPGTGSIITDQNYVFSGKPNNGDIDLTINAGNDYLVGNPYPSAIDANEFISDNTNTSGTLYFWEHWGGGSHIRKEYQGGYAIYNLSGGVPALAPDPDVAQIGVGTKTPSQYIPVGQGFFVTGISNGSINFENDQRIFVKEAGSNSLFIRSSNTTSNSQTNELEADDRMKFRIGFNSGYSMQLHRQLLLTIDENTTTDVDWAYDAILNEDQIDDMFWMINNDKYIIQGSNNSDVTAVYPIGIKVNEDGLNSITIDELKNVPEDINIYVHDIDLGLYHDLRVEDYEVFLNAGEYLNRFEITFDNTNNTLSIDDEINENLDILYSNDKEKIILINPNLIAIQSIELFNIVGQSIHTIKNISGSDYSEYNVDNLSTGTYIIKLRTAKDLVITKKILVN